MPGMAASTSETWVLGSAPNVVGAPEKSLASEITWAWTSSPRTISQSPVSPLIKDIFRPVVNAMRGVIRAWIGECPHVGTSRSGLARLASPGRRPQRQEPLHHGGRIVRCQLEERAQLVAALVAASEIGEAAKGDEGHAVGVGDHRHRGALHVQHLRLERREHVLAELGIVDEG